METNGLSTYMFCESVVDEVLSVITTLKAFIGGMGLHGTIPFFQPKVPKYMEDANKEFMRWAVDYELEERNTTKIEIDED